MDQTAGWLWIEHLFVNRERSKIVNKQKKFSKAEIWKVGERRENNG